MVAPQATEAVVQVVYCFRLVVDRHSQELGATFQSVARLFIADNACAKYFLFCSYRVHCWLGCFDCCCRKIERLVTIPGPTDSIFLVPLTVKCCGGAIVGVAGWFAKSLLVHFSFPSVRSRASTHSDRVVWVLLEKIALRSFPISPASV